MRIRDAELDFYMQSLFEQAVEKEIILKFPAEEYSIVFWQKFYKDLDNFRLFVFRNRIKPFYFELANKIDMVKLIKKQRKIILAPKTESDKYTNYIKRVNSFNNLLSKVNDVS